MKMINKIAGVALGLVVVGSSVFAQSLADAKKAIDAEKYKQAKAMLKNLTVTQANNDENYFYLGWVYLQQDYVDSAKNAFTKGISVNPKSALNYAGLGVVAHLSKDAAGETNNFNQAATLTSKKDSKPYIYMGEGLLMPLPGSKVANTADADKAITALKKAIAANPKDAEAALALGNAYRSQRNTSDAYNNYDLALSLHPKSPAVHVARGVLWSNAHNFDGAVKEYQEAINADPNFGPAYREWAETDRDWAGDNRAVAVEKINEGVQNYKKYMTLTDESDETLMRYADFLISAGKYEELQQVGSTLAKRAGSNIRVFRYLGYAEYENKDYTKGLNDINTWFSKAESTRILPRDYLYLGRLQIASGKDTVAGIANLKKASDLDSTLTEDAYKDIFAVYKKRGDYLGQATTYDELARKINTPSVAPQRVLSGVYYYFAFSKTKDSTLLVKGDTALAIASKAYTKPQPTIYLYRARIADLRDNNTDPTKTRGLAKPYYEKYIEILAATPPTDAQTKRSLAEAYAYMGNYYVNHDKDDAKAMEAYTKAKELDPENRQQKWYFDQKAAPAAAPAKKSK